MNCIFVFLYQLSGELRVSGPFAGLQVCWIVLMFVAFTTVAIYCVLQCSPSSWLVIDMVCYCFYCSHNSILTFLLCIGWCFCVFLHTFKLCYEGIEMHAILFLLLLQDFEDGWVNNNELLTPFHNLFVATRVLPLAVWQMQYNNQGTVR